MDKEEKIKELETMKAVLQLIRMELWSLLSPKEREYMDKTIDYISDEIEGLENNGDGN